MILLAAALASLNAPFSWFLGSWDCHGPHYHSINTFAAVQGSRWITNRWGPKDEPGGMAYIGYVPARHEWVYEDFHYDGGFGEVTSKGEQHGMWIWAGPYYTPDGTTLHGRIVYVLHAHARYDRLFEMPAGSSWKQTGSDTCTRL